MYFHWNLREDGFVVGGSPKYFPELFVPFRASWIPLTNLVRMFFLCLLGFIQQAKVQFNGSLRPFISQVSFTMLKYL